MNNLGSLGDAAAADAADSEVILVLLGHGILVIDCVYAVGLNALV